MKVENLVLAMVLFSLLAPRSVRAYIDPASGSIILQVLLGGIAGGILFFKLYWRKLMMFLGIRGRASDDSA